MKRRPPSPSVWSARSGPFLRRVTLLQDDGDPSRYPWNVRAFSHGIDLAFRSNITFFVGENGSGKSTLLEAIAECCLISTHSPILLSYPGATLYSLDGDSIDEIGYRETDHYRLTKDFLNAPERYFKTLFARPEDEDD
jgi:predicted ATPase